jgi:hypothetical protein
MVENGKRRRNLLAIYSEISKVVGTVVGGIIGVAIYALFTEGITRNGKNSKNTTKDFVYDYIK